VDREDSFNEEGGCLDSCDVLGNWNKVGESRKSVKDNEDQVLVPVMGKGSCKGNS